MVIREDKLQLNEHIEKLANQINGLTKTVADIPNAIDYLDQSSVDALICILEGATNDIAIARFRIRNTTTRSFRRSLGATSLKK